MSKPNCQWRGCSKTHLNLQFLLSRRRLPRVESLHFCSEECLKSHLESELSIRWQRIEQEKRQRVPRPKLGTILLQTTSLTPNQLEEALRLQKQSKNERLGDTLIRLGLVEERHITQAIAKQFGLPIMDLGNGGGRAEAAHLIPAQVARFARCVPVSLDDQDSVLRLAIAGPVNFNMHEAIRRMINKRVLAYVAHQSAIESSLNRLYPLDGPDMDSVAVYDSLESLLGNAQRVAATAIGERADDLRLELLPGLLWAKIDFPDKCHHFVCRHVLSPTHESVGQPGSVPIHAVEAAR